MSKIDKILEETPLEVRLNVTNQMGFIRLLTELGFREDKPWGSEDELLSKLCKFAEAHTNIQLTQIKQWELDGRPGEEKEITPKIPKYKTGDIVVWSGFSPCIGRIKRKDFDGYYVITEKTHNILHYLYLR